MMSKMILCHRMCQVLLLVLLLAVSCFGEKLSTGEDVGEFVRKSIKENKVNLLTLTNENDPTITESHKSEHRWFVHT